MKNLKIGTCLIVLGNILYLAYIRFCSGNTNSNFEDFSSGLLLGISIASNLVGIIITAKYIANNGKENEK